MVQQLYFKVSSVKGLPIISGIKYFWLEILMQAFHGYFFKTNLNVLLFVYLFFCPFPMKTAEFVFALRIVYSWNVPRYESEVSDTIQRQYNT